MSAEEAPQRANPKRMTFSHQSGTQLDQGYVAGLLDQFQDARGVRLDPMRVAVSALGLWSRVSLFARQHAPADGACRTDAKAKRRLPSRHAPVDRGHDALAKIE
jgi:hypothetical protein